MSTRGNLLVSTKTNTSARKITLLVGCVLFIILGLLVLSVAQGETFGYVLCALCIGYSLFYLILGFSNLNSYCEVYEGAVVGKTAMGLTTPVQNFEIKYSEISNVTDSGKAIQIYTQYTTYRIVAMSNSAQIVSEIRARMGKEQ